MVSTGKALGSVFNCFAHGGSQALDKCLVVGDQAWHNEIKLQVGAELKKMFPVFFFFLF